MEQGKMINKFKLITLTFLMLFLLNMVSAQIEISREILFELPAEVSSGLLGMRVSAGKVVFLNNLGKMIQFNLETNEAVSGKIRGQRLIDFDLILGQPVFLSDEGKLGGQVSGAWPKNGLAASRLEAADEGVILTGGGRMHFLPQNATEPFRVKNFHFALPVNNGFLWSMRKDKSSGPWKVALYDSYGNLMKEVYEFSADFAPTGIEIGPTGPEDEMLLSAYEDNQRKIILLGHNGYMMWKIDGPEKFCNRDLAFDDKGSLLVLEQNRDKVILSRWKFAVPQG
jgi:hypothetical protein